MLKLASIIPTKMVLLASGIETGAIVQMACTKGNHIFGTSSPLLTLGFLCGNGLCHTNYLDGIAPLPCDFGFYYSTSSFPVEAD